MARVFARILFISSAAGLALGAVLSTTGESLLDSRAFGRRSAQSLGDPRVAAFAADRVTTHKGSEEGVMVADLIAGESAEMNYNIIPSVIYTAPEIAWVGKTEQEIKESGRAYKTGSFPFAASGRAKAMEQTSGMVKIISAKDDDEILGVHIVGPMAGELIAEAVLAMEFSASTEDIQRTIHAHPSLAEAMHEASLAVDNKALNFPNK